MFIIKVLHERHKQRKKSNQISKYKGGITMKGCECFWRFKNRNKGT